MKNYCIDCGKEIINKKAKKCQLCYVKTLKGEGNPMFGVRRFGAENPNFKNGGKKNNTYCKCGKKMYYTSKECKVCANTGENNPNWKDGKSFEPYPLGWTKIFKKQIRDRDEHKCQMCGHSEIEYKVKLHVHHIDYNKTNLNPINLISLCHSCHSKTNLKNREYWKEYFKYIIEKKYGLLR